MNKWLVAALMASMQIVLAGAGPADPDIVMKDVACVPDKAKTKITILDLSGLNYVPAMRSDYPVSEVIGAGECRKIESGGLRFYSVRYIGRARDRGVNAYVSFYDVAVFDQATQNLATASSVEIEKLETPAQAGRAAEPAADGPPSFDLGFEAKWSGDRAAPILTMRFAVPAGTEGRYEPVIRRAKYDSDRRRFIDLR
jgi:hypothetical protein